MTGKVENIPPGSTIGILGGGQLGRMTALAAAQLGYKCHIFDPDEGGPAAEVSAQKTTAAFDDLQALDDFAAQIDVATLEFENIPVESLEYLSKKVPVRPGAKALETAQDRIVEKSFLQHINIPTTPFRVVRGPSELKDALTALGRPSVLKTARLGYDGKGQVAIDADKDAEAAYKEMGATRGILEQWVDFDLEISVIAARGPDGNMATFVPVENRHKNHILDKTIAPARIAPNIAAQAETITRQIVDALDVIGLLAVEMFVTRDGNVLVNEIAPRPHNSGHWTMDACVTSQFEQFVRAICGLPLGDPRRHSDAVMHNLIGTDAADWARYLNDQTAHLHLYGKKEMRDGRKMGHVNQLFTLNSLAQKKTY